MIAIEVGVTARFPDGLVQGDKQPPGQMAVLIRQPRKAVLGGKTFELEPLLIAGPLKTLHAFGTRRGERVDPKKISWNVQIGGLNYELSPGDQLNVFGPGEEVHLDLSFLGLTGLATTAWVGPQDIEEAKRSIAREF